MGTITISGDNVTLSYSLETVDTIKITGSSCVIQNYTFAASGKLDVDAACTVTNCIFESSGNIDLASGVTLTAVNCCFGCSEATVETPGGTVTDTDCLFSTDPLFYADDDYRLADDSPCVDAGVAISGLTEDIDGIPIGSPPNIGCYERHVDTSGIVTIVYNSHAISMPIGRTGLLTGYTQEYKQNKSGSGKIEQINLYGMLELSVDMYLDADTYRKMVGWWSWARQGKTWALSLDNANICNTLLDDSAAAGQNVIPLTSTSRLAAGDYCWIRAVDNDDEFELVKVAGVTDGVSIDAENDLVFSYSSGDIFRHRDYFPSCINLDNEFRPRPLYRDLYAHTIRFAELCEIPT